MLSYTGSLMPTRFRNVLSKKMITLFGGLHILMSQDHRTEIFKNQWWSQYASL